MHDSRDGGGRAASGTAAEEDRPRRERLPRAGVRANLTSAPVPLPLSPWERAGVRANHGKTGPHPRQLLPAGRRDCVAGGMHYLMVSSVTGRPGVDVRLDRAHGPACRFTILLGPGRFSPLTAQGLQATFLAAFQPVRGHVTRVSCGTNPGDR